MRRASGPVLMLRADLIMLFILFFARPMTLLIVVLCAADDAVYICSLCGR